MPALPPDRADPSAQRLRARRTTTAAATLSRCSAGPALHGRRWAASARSLDSLPSTMSHAIWRSRPQGRPLSHFRIRTPAPASSWGLRGGMGARGRCVCSAALGPVRQRAGPPRTTRVTPALPPPPRNRAEAGHQCVRGVFQPLYHRHRHRRRRVCRFRQCLRREYGSISPPTHHPPHTPSRTCAQREHQQSCGNQLLGWSSLLEKGAPAHTLARRRPPPTHAPRRATPRAPEWR